VLEIWKSFKLINIYDVCGWKPSIKAYRRNANNIACTAVIFSLTVIKIKNKIIDFS